MFWTANSASLRCIHHSRSKHFLHISFFLSFFLSFLVSHLVTDLFVTETILTATILQLIKQCEYSIFPDTPPMLPVSSMTSTNVRTARRSKKRANISSPTTFRRSSKNTFVASMATSAAIAWSLVMESERRMLAGEQAFLGWVPRKACSQAR